MSSIAEILPPWKGAQNHLQTTWVWIEVSYPVEQPLRCDLLKLILSIRGICPLLWTDEFPARVISKLTSNFEVIMPFAHFSHLFFFLSKCIVAGHLNLFFFLSKCIVAGHLNLFVSRQ